METTPNTFNSKNNPAWCVVEGLVNPSKGYIKIVHESYALPYALIQLSRSRTVVVQYYCGEKPWYKLAQTTLAKIKEDITYYILQIDVPNPWTNALHHATTPMVSYSKIQWIWHRDGKSESIKTMEYNNQGGDENEEEKDDYSPAYRQYKLGQAHLDVGELDEALIAFNRSIELENDHADAYLWRGITLRRMDKLKSALREFDKVLKLKPDYDYAYSHRGFVNYLMEQYPEALADYTAAIKLDPEYAYYYSARGNVFAERAKKGDYEAALKDIDKAIELEPTGVWFHKYKADVNIKMGKLDLAEDNLNDAMGVDPGNIQAFAILAQVKDARQHGEAFGLTPECE